MKTIEQILERIEGRRDLPHRGESLRRFEKAFRKWGFLNVHLGENIICVAGTNGKGTVSKALETGFLTLSDKVGLFTSPHLIRTNERIRVGNQDISDQHFVQTFERIEKWIDEFQLSHFEILTLMALDYMFSGALVKKVEYAIFEVGLGGLLDPTSVIPHQTSVITKLGLDHQAILGNSILEIAVNKLGIVRAGNLVIHAKMPTEVQDAFLKTQQRNQARFIEALPFPYEVQSTSQSLQYILKSPWGDLVLPSPGVRSVENFSIALRVFAELGLNVDKILPKLSQSFWPGRMELLKVDSSKEARTPIYLSGDHNVQGIESLREILSQLNYRQIHIVLGIGQNKDHQSMALEFLKISRAKFYLTQSPYRGVASQEFAEQLLSISEFQNDEPMRALDAALEKAGPGDVILVTGSLYLVGYVRGQLLAKNQ